MKKEIEVLKIVLNTKLPQNKKWDSEKILSLGYNKVLLGYLNSFIDHCPIKVSPNVIWQLILNAFSRCVNSNSEKLRNKFVNFEGIKDLNVIKVGSLKDVYRYEKEIIEELVKKISHFVGSKLVDILTPNFSTTTEESCIAGKVSIMSAFKRYFRYKGSMTVCGIPYILLEGTLEDWEKILEKGNICQNMNFLIKNGKRH